MYVSTDAGTSWAPQLGLGLHNWLSVSLSRGGDRVAAVCYQCPIYTGYVAETQEVAVAGPPPPPFDPTVAYPVTLMFNRFAHGVSDGVPSFGLLELFVRTFKERNNILVVAAFKIGLPFNTISSSSGSSEYRVVFPLTELSVSQQFDFLQTLKAMAVKSTDNGYFICEGNYINNGDITAMLPNTAVVETVIF